MAESQLFTYSFMPVLIYKYVEYAGNCGQLSERYRMKENMAILLKELTLKCKR